MAFTLYHARILLEKLVAKKDSPSYCGVGLLCLGFFSAWGYCDAI